MYPEYIKTKLFLIFIFSMLTMFIPIKAYHRRSSSSIDNRDNSEQILRTFYTNSKRNSGLTPRIYGGSEAARNEFPSIIALNVKEGFICGGTIIAKRLILSAAHCFENHRTSFTDKEKKYIVVAGDYNIAKLDGTEQKVSIEEVIIHPKYKGIASHGNDIAIIILAEPLSYNQAVSSIELNLSQDMNVMENIGLTAGWGQTEGSVSRNILRKLELPILTRKDCKQIYYNLRDYMFCAGGALGKGSCFGDSGGPLYCRKKGNANWMLCGIVSFGTRNGCGLNNNPTVYISVAHFKDFIYSVKKYMD